MRGARTTAVFVGVALSLGLTVSAVAGCRATPPPPAPVTTTTTVDEPEPGEVVGCEEVGRWNTDPQAGEGYTDDEIYRVRIGQHDCFDRVVFDIDGTAEVGFATRYVAQVHAGGSGEPMPVAGDAVLEVVVTAPVGGFPGGVDGDADAFARSGELLYGEHQLVGLTNLRAVRFAGFFEGQATFAIGLRDEVPFRAFIALDDKDGHRTLIVDIAHE